MKTDLLVSRHIGINPQDEAEMLHKIGVNSVDELIDKTIPHDIRLTHPLTLPPAMTENEYAHHIGHLALANWLCEFEELDEVWFLITPQNPLKQKSDLLDDDLRLRMARAAIADYPKFKVSDIEFHLPQPSYTIDTLHTLSQTYPERDFYFIMGADNWTIFPRWRKHEEILREYPILIYPRKGFDILIPDAYPNVKKVDAPLMEISSTFIREAFRAGKDIRFFLPEGVRPYLTPETSPLNPPVSSGPAGILRNPSASPDNEP